MYTTLCNRSAEESHSGKRVRHSGKSVKSDRSAEESLSGKSVKSDRSAEESLSGKSVKSDSESDTVRFIREG